MGKENNCIRTDDLITVAKYAKNRKKESRNLLYYYIRMGFLKSVDIGGVIFVKRNARVILPKKLLDEPLCKREQKAKAYLEKENIKIIPG